MHLYIDPTEAREGTRIPQPLLDQAVLLPGFEAITGADWMITPLKWPDGVKCTNSKPVAMRMERHVDAGAIFIQRKSGGDFIQSIPELKGYQERMNRWLEGYQGRGWLLSTGIRIKKIDGQWRAVADGNEEHSCPLSSMQGALTKWRLRNGNVVELAYDKDMTPWVAHMMAMLQSCLDEPIREFNLWNPIQKLAREPDNWVTTGSAFPEGIGRKKLEALARELGSQDPVRRPPPLHKVIECLTAGRIVNAKGWGKTLQKRLLAWWGLPEDGSRIVRDVPRFESITIKFDTPLPFEVEGDGIENLGENEYRFYNYESLSAVGLMLRGIPE